MQGNTQMRVGGRQQFSLQKHQPTSSIITTSLLTKDCRPECRATGKKNRRQTAGEPDHNFYALCSSVLIIIHWIPKTTEAELLVIGQDIVERHAPFAAASSQAVPVTGMLLL